MKIHHLTASLPSRDARLSLPQFHQEKCVLISPVAFYNTWINLKPSPRENLVTIDYRRKKCCACFFIRTVHTKNYTVVQLCNITVRWIIDNVRNRLYKNGRTVTLSRKVYPRSSLSSENILQVCMADTMAVR